MSLSLCFGRLFNIGSATFDGVRISKGRGCREGFLLFPLLSAAYAPMRMIAYFLTQHRLALLAFEKERESFANYAAEVEVWCEAVSAAAGLALQMEAKAS